MVRKVKVKSHLLMVVIGALLFTSCDFTKRKVKSGINLVIKEVADVFVDFLTLPDRTVKRDVSTEELFGEWVLTESSLKIISSQLSKYPDWESITLSSLRFHLKDDSTVEAWIYKKYEPISMFQFPLNEADSMLVRGKWSVDKDLYSNNESSQVFKNNLILDFDLTENRSFTIDFNISEENGQLLVWSYIGDPDQLKYQEYHKK